MLGEKAFIKKCKNKGIDIVIDSTGFKTVYYVYSAFNKEGERFESFKEVKMYCQAIVEIK